MSSETPTEVPPLGKKLIIDEEIQFLCRPLGKNERSILERDIEEHGCINPIIYWEGHDIIIDGHNRYEICNRIGKPYNCIPMHFETKEDVMKWVIDHQLGRRNLSVEDISYLRGKRYITEKKVAHRPSGGELHQNDGVSGETAKRIAKQTGVSQATIERDARRAEAIDKLREGVSNDFAKKLRGKEIRLTKDETIELSESKDMKALAAEIEKGKTLSQAKQVLMSITIVNPEETIDSSNDAEMKERLVKAKKNLQSAFKNLNGVKTANQEMLSELILLCKEINQLVMAIACNSISPEQCADNRSNESQSNQDNLHKNLLELKAVDYNLVKD